MLLEFHVSTCFTLMVQNMHGDTLAAEGQNSADAIFHTPASIEVP